MPMFTKPFDFKPFTEDLDDPMADILRTDPGGFARILLDRAGINPAGAQRGRVNNAANWAAGLQGLYGATSPGLKAADLQGENMFGRIFGDYVSPNKTPNQSFSGSLIDRLRSLKGQQNLGGTDRASKYVYGDTNSGMGMSDEMLNQIMSILARRMGPYMSRTFLGDDFTSDIRAKYLQRQQSLGEKVPDPISFLMELGIL